ncbi:hypothetical protein LSM04_001504 [Trypanosoma melophagium]|uniref:uncharacterized protein n=1 Tax=Trypanosoma melophagium TaxID=715481 RepID=UPI00351A0456|nr:hypothetical protein LSM04_001504 [Trypanosoma melophagium]
MVKLDNDVGMTKLNSSKDAKYSTKGESTSSKTVNKSPESTGNPRCNIGEVKIFSSLDSSFTTSDAATQMHKMMRDSCAHTRSVSRPRISSIYTRNSSLADGRSHLPPRHMWVKRENAASRKRPDWNSQRKTVDEPQREKLPRIRLKSQNKYDFLYNGKSVTKLSRNPSNYKKHVVGFLPECSRKK